MKLQAKKDDYSKILLGHGIKFGKSLTDTKKQDIHLLDDVRKGHFCCFGTTRVGKTRLIENMLEQDIKAGRSVIVIDPKGDNELFSKITQVCMQTGRLQDLDLITPIFPQYSLKINPLKHFYIKEEVIGNVMAGVDAEAFYYSVAYETTFAIVDAVLLLETVKHRLSEIEDKLIINYELIRSYVSRDNLDNLKMLLQEETEKLEIRLSSLSEQEAIELDIDVNELLVDCRRVIDNLQKIVDSGTEYYNKVSTSLRTALSSLCDGNVGRVVGQAFENNVIDKLQSGRPTVLYVQVGSLLAQQTAYVLGKVIVSMLGTLVGRKFAMGGAFSPTINLYLDEAQNILYNNIDDLFAKVGGGGLRIHLFCQSVNQIYDKLGREKGKAILDNTNTKIFMRVSDPESAKYASELFGSVKEFAPVFSVGGGGASLRDNEVAQVEYPMFNKIGVQDFYMSTYDGLYKGKTTKTSLLEKLIEFPSTSI